MDLTGRRILVTGASSGIGAAAARRLHAAGAAVALLARSPDRLDVVAEELPGATVVACDLTGDGVDDAVARAADAMGGLDGLVNAAGVAMPGGLRDGDPADWRAMFEVNVLGLLAATRAALPHLEVAELADVVNVSSMSGRRVASSPLGIYSGSKFAVHAISQSMALELADTDVRVTVLAPGYVDTPIFEGRDRAEEYRQRVSTRGLDPAAVAAQVVHVVGQPADVRLVEVAMLSTRQG